jgi:hypothetical protein
MSDGSAKALSTLVATRNMMHGICTAPLAAGVRYKRQKQRSLPTSVWYTYPTKLPTPSSSTLHIHSYMGFWDKPTRSPLDRWVAKQSSLAAVSLWKSLKQPAEYQISRLNHHTITWNGVSCSYISVSASCHVTSLICENRLASSEHRETNDQVWWLCNLNKK